MTSRGLRKIQAKFELCSNFSRKCRAIESWFGHFFRLACAKWFL